MHPPPSIFVCKVFEGKTLGLDFELYRLIFHCRWEASLRGTWIWERGVVRACLSSLRERVGRFRGFAGGSEMGSGLRSLRACRINSTSGRRPVRILSGSLGCLFGKPTHAMKPHEWGTWCAVFSFNVADGLHGCEHCSERRSHFGVGSRLRCREPLLVFGTALPGEYVDFLRTGRG